MAIAKRGNGIFFQYNFNGKLITHNRLAQANCNTSFMLFTWLKLAGSICPCAHIA